MFKLNIFFHNKYGDNMNKSIWLDNIESISFPDLEKDCDCDILIIGGGITGVCCSYFLKESNKKVILVESNKIAHGTSSKTTGKLTFLQEDNLLKIKNIYNEKKAIDYLSSQKLAIELAKDIITTNKINCDLEEVNSYIFTNNKNNIFKITDTYNIIKNYCSASTGTKIPLKIKSYSSIKVNNTYVFHPVKFIFGVIKSLNDNIQIYENTRVINLTKRKDYWIAETTNHIIKAKKVILACHYPFFLKPYFFPLKTSIEKSYLIATKTEEIKPISIINIDQKVLSFRFHQNENKYFIFVGESNDLYKNINDDYKDKQLTNFMNNHFNNKISHSWSNHDIMTSDYMPLIGKIDTNLFLATGYNTWGMTNGILAGKIISDIILRKKNSYISLFNPLRKIENIPQIINYNFKNGIAFLSTKINKKKSFYQDNVKIIKEDGIWYGIYTDNNNIEHKVLNKCPHMKCNLYFNYQTKSWDCPCHGSSFDIDGNIIYGPSTYNIKEKK